MRMEQFNCPSCQGFIGEAAKLEYVKDAIVGPIQIKIMEILSKRISRPVQMVDIINYCYEDDPNGGPSDPRTTVSIAIMKLRKTLKQYGWYIQKKGGGGVGTSGGALYRLIPYEAWT